MTALQTVWIKNVRPKEFTTHDKVYFLLPSNSLHPMLKTLSYILKQ